MPKFAGQILHHLTPVSRAHPGSRMLPQGRDRPSLLALPGTAHADAAQRRVVAGGVPEFQVKPAAVCIALAIK